MAFKRHKKPVGTSTEHTEYNATPMHYIIQTMTEYPFIVANENIENKLVRLYNADDEPTGSLLLQLQVSESKGESECLYNSDMPVHTLNLEQFSISGSCLFFLNYII